jgi:hypothetical protein
MHRVVAAKAPSRRGGSIIAQGGAQRIGCLQRFLGSTWREFQFGNDGRHLYLHCYRNRRSNGHHCHNYVHGHCELERALPKTEEMSFERA